MSKLTDALAVPTYRNTTVVRWWGLLNAATAALGIPDTTFGPAKGYYDMGYCPQTAAADLAAIDD